MFKKGLEEERGKRRTEGCRAAAGTTVDKADGSL